MLGGGIDLDIGGFQNIAGGKDEAALEGVFTLAGVAGLMIFHQALDRAFGDGFDAVA